MKHTHNFTKIVPSQSLMMMNLQCDFKNCHEIKTVNALEVVDMLEAQAAAIKKI